MLNLSNGEFKIKMINRLRALIDKVDSMQEKMDNVSRETEMLGKRRREKLGRRKCTDTDSIITFSSITK